MCAIFGCIGCGRGMTGQNLDPMLTLHWAHRRFRSFDKKQPQRWALLEGPQLVPDTSPLKLTWLYRQRWDTYISGIHRAERSFTSIEKTGYMKSVNFIKPIIYTNTSSFIFHQIIIPVDVETHRGTSSLGLSETGVLY